VPQLELPLSCFSIDGVEYYGNMSFLKAGLFYADHITTVSPNYAREIQQEELGFDCRGCFRCAVTGSPACLTVSTPKNGTPPPTRTSQANTAAADMSGKAINKQALQNRLGLNPDPDVPLLGVVSRFTHQKGLDILLEIAPRLTELPAAIGNARQRRRTNAEIRTRVVAALSRQNRSDGRLQ